MDVVNDFEKYEQDITRYALDRVNTYFSSKCYSKLLNRTKILNDSNNMKFGSGKSANRGASEWMSKVAFPVVLHARRLREAALNAVFRVDPIVTLSPLSETPHENAIKMQEVLSANFKATKFKQKILKPCVFKSLAYYGNAITRASFDSSVEEFWQTQNTPVGTQRINVSKTRRNATNKFVRLLNYFQNPFIIDPEDSDYQGSIEWVTLDYLMKRVNDGNYIEKNLKHVIQDAKDAAIADGHYDPTIERDMQRYTLDLTCMYLKFYLEGNDNFEKDYYVEICRDKIIRIEENQNDYNIRPYSVYSIDNRFDYWWANTDSELQMPHENFMNLVGNIMADNALSSSRRMVLYRKGMLDTADINNRHKNNGFIPIEIAENQKFQDIMQQVQFQDNSSYNYDQIIREVKESMQSVSSNYNSMSKGSQSGPANKTAYAASLVAQENDIVESSIMESVGNGIIDCGYKNTVLLQQHLSEKFYLRPEIKMPEKEVWKEEILGRFAYEPANSLEKNAVADVENILNKATQLLNLRNNGATELQALNLVKVFREAIRKMQLPGDVDDILPEAPQQQVAPMGAPQPQLTGGMPNEAMAMAG